MTDKIYGMRDPRTGATRYVGYTAHTLAERLAGHLDVSVKSTGTYCIHWIRQLQSAGLAPEIYLLEEVQPGDDWRERERFWIQYGRTAGWPLTNLKDGGDGGSYPITEEHRAKISSSLKGRRKTEEHKEKLRMGWTAERRAANAEMSRQAALKREARRRELGLPQGGQLHRDRKEDT